MHQKILNKSSKSCYKSPIKFLFPFFTIFLYLIFLNFNNGFSQTVYKGILKGKILDRVTQKPVSGASVFILNHTCGKESDINGEFEFDSLEYSTYQVKITAPNYYPLIKSDLVVYSSKPLEIILFLNSKGYTTEEIDVEADYFQQSSDVNVSSLNLDFEEIRRAPGAAEDISRMLQSAPGVSTGNDSRNDLIVRGGSPSENLILIDGIEFPNINHFGTQGSSSGAIGFINSKFILESNFLTGGFSSLYGDKMSSVVDIKFKEGSKKHYYNDVNLSIAGFGIITEGPINRKSSYLLSVRRSYLELIRSSIRLSSTPNYWDINLKISYDLSPKDKISLVGLLGIDKAEFSGGTDNDNPWGEAYAKQKTLGSGINYIKLFKKGYLQTVLSDSYVDYNLRQIENKTNQIRFKSNSYENELIIKSNLNYELSKNIILNAGIGGKYISISNDMYLKGDTNYAGYVYNKISANVYKNTFKLFSHINISYKLLKDKITFNTGFRYDYFDLIRLKSYFSPRLGVSFKLTRVTSFNAGYGIYYQSPAYVWITSNPRNTLLNNIRSEHFVVGFEHKFSSDIKSTVEFYLKHYSDYPVWKDIPYFILIDGGTNFGPNIVGEAVSAGKGYVRGFDISIQKKLSGDGLYGFLNYSFSNSNFTALAGNEKPGSFDPVHSFTLIGGYQIKDDWLIGLKFKYSGGKPYTPIDVEKSKSLGRGFFKTNEFNSERYPYYMRIDVRVDKKFNFRKISIITYVELQNILDRANIFDYFWNEDKNELGTIYQWAFFPIGGISVQF